MENTNLEGLNFEINDDEEDDDDGYDDFFFDSIQRYSTLQMFNLENVPYHIFQLDETSICVASKHAKRNNSEILKLRLPDKLTLPVEEEGRSKGNDFKVLSGLYTENLVYKTDKLTNDGSIITSEKNVCGLSVYKFSLGSLGVKRKGVKVKVANWTEPDFVVMRGTNNLICSKCHHGPLLLVDVTAEKEIKKIRHPFYADNGTEGTDCCDVNNIKSEVLGEDLIAVLNRNTGDTVVHDLRTENVFTCVPGIVEKDSKELWTLSKCDSQSFLSHFGIVSNKNSFCLYDIRTNMILTQRYGDSVPGGVENLRLKFNKGGDRFSISGTNSLVEIYNLTNGEYLHVFTHNGHCPRGLSSNFVTDHIWLRTNGKEFVVSICDNKTLNCWDYNPVAGF